MAEVVARSVPSKGADSQANSVAKPVARTTSCLPQLALMQDRWRCSWITEWQVTEQEVTEPGLLAQGPASPELARSDGYPVQSVRYCQGLEKAAAAGYREASLG